MTTIDSALITSMGVREHFRDALETAAHNQDVNLDDMTSVYVINLLTAFADSRVLRDVSDEGRHIKPLALIYAEAVEAESNEQRNRTLQKLGDIALFISGLYTDSLARRAVDIDYYIGMGEAAYGTLQESIASGGRGMLCGELFEDLCRQFTVLVDLLGEISEMSGMKTNSDVLRTYEIWLRTGSGRAARQLARSGIHPLPGSNPSVRH